MTPLARRSLLNELHLELAKVFKDGETFEAFHRRVRRRFQLDGWETSAPEPEDMSVRLRRAYHNVFRAWHAAAQRSRADSTKALLPYLVYGLGPSDRHREQHVAWDGLSLPVAHPWWRTHWPPNGWGCKCWVRQVAFVPDGAKTTAPSVVYVDGVDPVAGEAVRVPDGVDPGWAAAPCFRPGDRPGAQWIIEAALDGHGRRPD